MELGILFADMRGFTAMSEHMAPEEVAHLLNSFYKVATNVLLKHDSIIDKLVGDEVMALFLTGLTGPDCCQKMTSAAEELLRGVGYGSSERAWLPLGVGTDFGTAFVGTLGSGDVKDFTAVGDVVNTAARLQSEARPGQIVMSERVYRDVAERYHDTRRVELELKGKSESVVARVVEIVSPA